MNNNYNVGLYIRLSREDDDKIMMSESITNQKSLLLQYAKENNLRVYDIYIDDGFSGTNFDRPGFIRLIKDIELKKINMVITKDMSRLGRDYIGTGELVEKFFPKHNVRYIAVTDNIDTYLDSPNNDIAPFKAIMNDFYAKDISKKIKSSLKAKMKEGKYVGGRAPFGYTKDPNNKNQLLVDEEQAIIVKRIFDMALNGLSYYKIADILTNEGIKTPAAYYGFEWCGNYNPHFNKWNSKTIYDILNNRIYTGDLVQGRRYKVNYKVKKIVKNSPDNYIVVENTHEAIIHKDIFNEVEKKLPKNVGRKEKKENNLFDGLLYCGDCGHRISVQARRKKDNKHYTLCNYYRTYRKEHLCTTHSNNYDKLEEEIINNLRHVCFKYLDKNKVKDSVFNNYKNNNINSSEKEIEILLKDINQINDNLDNIYIDKLNNTITEDQFNRIKSKLELELNRRITHLNELRNGNIDEINQDNFNQKIEKYINKFLSMKNPSRELIVNLIDRIDIYEDKRIDVKLSFKKN
ncbi:MAG: recombinase family protein [Bacilli bacterium]|nr:recombinase family protein [Bacilli bacterium]